ncbi:MAG: glycine cleavage system aminomethyltransferase GcvT [bacterium]
MKQLPLHSQHAALKAKFGEFADFNMPLYYTKPLEEHHAVRQDAGVFDISHMGQFMLAGERAGEMLHYVLSSNVRALNNGQALYSLMCREDGGILDDLIIYRYDAARYRMIVNAATRERDFLWLADLAKQFDVRIDDVTSQFCLFAVQGPKALGKLEGMIGPGPSSMDYFTFMEAQSLGNEIFLARTGYTGEPGLEMAVPVEKAGDYWHHLVEGLGIPPIGLAARDTLRLEACLPLYGHEMNLQRHPWESGLGWSVHMDEDENFIGKKALIAIKGVGFPYRLVGLEMTDRGIPREDYRVLLNGSEVGRVTSGVLSPTTGKGIALARVRIPNHKTGTPLQVEIRGKGVDAVVVPRPFYKNPDLRNKKGKSTAPRRIKLFR